MRAKMMLAAGLMAGVSAVAQAEVMPIDMAAKVFGARENAWQADLSPSGRKIVYLTAGPGTQTVVRVLDLDTKKTSSILASSGKPESLDWCEFASETQLICRYSGTAEVDATLLGFSRLATLSLMGKEVRPLGSRNTGYDMYVRQSDGAVLDWLPDDEGSVLMARTYVPKIEESSTNIKDNREGVGVDKVDLASLRSKTIEQPKRDVSHYMTDGRGNVRIMAYSEMDNVGQLKGITSFRYRKAGSRDWEKLGEHNTRGDIGIWPLASRNLPTGPSVGTV